MSSELVITLLSVVLGGGVITAIVGGYKALGERRKTEAEADALGITTPIQAESVSIATMTVALNGARAINEDNTGRIEGFKKELEDMRGLVSRVRQESEAEYYATQHDLRRLREALDAAEQYVGVLLVWIEEKLPGSRPPKRKVLNTEDDRGTPPPT